MALNPAGLRWKQAANGTSSITKPGLTIQGDLMVVIVAGTSGSTAPAGWLQKGSTSASYGGYYLKLWYKVHGDEASTTSYTFTGSTECFMVTFAGADVDNPLGAVGAWESETSTTTPTYSGLTTEAENSWALAWCLDYSASSSYTAPGGWTERSDASGVCSDTKPMATPGATGSMDWTASGSSNFAMVGVEIRASKVARRLYFDSAAAAPLTPSTLCAQWDLNTASPLTRKLNDVRGSSAQSWRTYVDASSTNNEDSFLARFVVMLGTGYIQGGFLAVLQCAESSNSANDFSQISIKIIDPSGADRAVLFAGQTDTGTTGSEFPLSNVSPYQANAANRYFPKATLSRAMTPAYCYEGDALVVEIGYRQNSTGTTYTTNMYIGEPSATDLTDANETETTDNTPWIEFPWGLTLQGEGPEMAAQPIAYRLAT